MTTTHNCGCSISVAEKRQVNVREERQMKELKEDERVVASERGAILIGAHALAYGNIARYTADAVCDLLCAADSRGADSGEIMGYVMMKLGINKDDLWQIN